MTADEYEKLAAEEKKHFVNCAECNQLVLGI
jgi:hypothetical protein